MNASDTAPDTQREPHPIETADAVDDAQAVIRDRTMLLYRDPGKSRMWSAEIDHDLPRLRREALAMCERMAQHLQAITWAAHALPEE